MIFMMKNLLTKYSETMKSRLFSYLFFLCFLTPLLWADYTDRMKARLPDVLSAKDAGTVGEGVDGFLHLREASNRSAAKLVDSENEDRKQLFKDLAVKTGGDVAAVARATENITVFIYLFLYTCSDFNASWHCVYTLCPQIIC